MSKISKATVTKITATSRVAIRIKDNYYTVEYSEERSLPTDVEVDLDFERETLWEEVNKCVDMRCKEILLTFKN